jgi:hypothetical protein
MNQKNHFPLNLKATAQHIHATTYKLTSHFTIIDISIFWLLLNRFNDKTNQFPRAQFYSRLISSSICYFRRFRWRCGPIK